VITEWQNLVADDLADLVPLPAISNASPGCSAAIPAVIASARSPMSLAPFASARMAARIVGRIFAARIVVGDDHLICILRRDRAHDRALAGVAVTAGAEDHDELAFRVRPQRLQRFASASGLCA